MRKSPVGRAGPDVGEQGELASLHPRTSTELGDVSSLTSLLLPPGITPTDSGELCWLEIVFFFHLVFFMQ